MKSIEASGKTVKEAMKNGLSELGCDASDVDIQVLEMGSPGLFGMFGKPAKVRLTKKDDDEDLGIEMPVITLDGGNGKKPARPERKKQSKPEPAEEPAHKEQPKEEKIPEAKAAVEKKPRQHARKEPKQASVSVEEATVAVETKPFEATPEEELTEESKRAREFLMGLTQHMGVPVSVETCQSADQLRFQMSGENMSILIGRRGETLDALQYLTSLMVNRGREDYLRVSLDTENYRAKREDALRKLAVRMAAKAKKTGKRVALEPMNPYERRILHSALQNDPAVTTHSEGEEPYRRVIITLK